LVANNNQQVGIAYYNLATAYLKVNRYKSSEENYKKSITFASIEDDIMITYTSQLRLVELALLQDENDKARTLFKQLPILSVNEKLSENFKTLHQDLKLRLPLE